MARHNRKHLPAPSKDTLKTSTQPIEKMKQENLTLWDWLTVYAYVDTLPQPIKQGEVVQYFATRPQGTLLFSQSTLSHKLRQHLEMEAHVDSILNALSSKRPHAVTRPDVDHALWLWVQQMDWKGETVNGGMLVAKREAFEKALEVPEDKRLLGPGWIQPFCTV